MPKTTKTKVARRRKPKPLPELIPEDAELLVLDDYLDWLLREAVETASILDSVVEISK